MGSGRPKRGPPRRQARSDAGEAHAAYGSPRAVENGEDAEFEHVAHEAAEDSRRHRRHGAVPQRRVRIHLRQGSAVVSLPCPFPQCAIPMAPSVRLPNSLCSGAVRLHRSGTVGLVYGDTGHTASRGLLSSPTQDQAHGHDKGPGAWAECLNLCTPHHRTISLVGNVAANLAFHSRAAPVVTLPAPHPPLDAGPVQQQQDVRRYR